MHSHAMWQNLPSRLQTILRFSLDTTPGRDTFALLTENKEFLDGLPKLFLTTKYAPPARPTQESFSFDRDSAKRSKKLFLAFAKQ